MKKLNPSEKKEITGGVTAMGLATGILTVTSILNSIIDILKRYWGGVGANTAESFSSSVALPFSADSPAAYEQWLKSQEFRNYNSSALFNS